MLRMTTSN